MSAAVDAKGQLYAWGQIYNEDDRIDVFFGGVPTLQACEYRVRRVVCAGHHTFALTDTGDVLSFGSSCCLGHPDDHPDWQPSLDESADYSAMHKPRVIEALRNVRAVAIAAGSDHCLVLTDEGTVLSWGCGQYGKLGHGDEEYQEEPKVIEALRGVRVVAILASDTYSMVLTDEGAVLLFGVARGRQLGYVDGEDHLVPKVIEALRGVRAVAIAGSDSHSMVLTHEGIVLSYGNHEGLGHSEGKNQHKPKVVEALRGVRVVAVAAGHKYSMVLTDAGVVLSFGMGNLGQLGHGDRQDYCTPKVIEALRGVRVVAISAGLEHSMVLTDEGAVLSFGCGDAERTLHDGHGNRLGHAESPIVKYFDAWSPEGSSSADCAVEATPRLIAGLRALTYVPSPAAAVP